MISLSRHSLSGGELFDYVTSKDFLVESEAVMFLKQILVALEYIHSKSICHLDMKVKPALLSYIHVGSKRLISSVPVECLVCRLK